MKSALFPGSFDPPSLGHLDILQRAASLCDTLYVGVAPHLGKQAHFSTDEKMEMLRRMTDHLPGVKVVAFNQLVVDFAKELGVNILVRGLRAFSDFEYEFRMALANRKMGGIETWFLMADPKLSYISSTLIRDVAKHGSRLGDFVPPVIEDQVFRRLSKK